LQAVKQNIAQTNEAAKREGKHTRADMTRTAIDICSNIEHARVDIAESSRGLAGVITQTGAVVQEDIVQTSRRALSIVDNNLRHTNNSVTELHADVKILRKLVESLNTDDAGLNFIFEGSNIAALAEPLTLMKEDIQRTIQAAANFNPCEHLAMTEFNVRWLQDEIWNLIASSYEVAAEYERSGESISQPPWMRGNTGYDLKKRKFCLESSKSVTPGQCSRIKSATMRKASSSYKQVKIKTAKGIIEFKWFISTESDFSAKSILADISIRPNIELSSTLVQVHLMKEWRPDILVPNIERMISVWNLRPLALNPELIQCLKTDDLDSFQGLLVNGQVSLYDRDLDRSLIEVSKFSA
jgi:hypothetical protein